MINLSHFQNKKILITGGLGFIGSNLAKRLTETNAEIILIDSLIPEYGGNIANVESIKDKVKINISDVRDPFSMKHLIQGADYLFNLAGQTSHMDSMTDPYTDLEINGKAQLSILESCRNYNPDVKIIFASTRQIYGKPQYLPVDEKHLVQPVDVNGINKMAGEWYHILYNNVYGIRSCALRLTNTYGPFMRVKDARQTFVGIWIKNLIENKPFEVWGGDQLRDFTFADDVVDGLLVAASNENSNGKIYNLGGNEIISLKELAESMISVFGSGSFTVKQFPEERKKIDIGDYYSDWNLIKKELGWKPEIKIRDGMKTTLDFYKTNLEKYL